MLAWEMNGEPLPRIHGFPLRVVVFGYIGARSVKWLTRINVIDKPSEAPVQKKEYLYYNPQVGKQNAAYSNGFSIQDMPVSSAIMTPVTQAQIIHDGKIHLRGWAYSGGGHWPIRVDISGDGGSIWYEVPHENLSKKYYHAWRIWQYDLPVDAEGWIEVCVRTWDNALNTQVSSTTHSSTPSFSPFLLATHPPTSPNPPITKSFIQPTYVRSAWNWDLHVTSSCHRIKIYSMNTQRAATRKRIEYCKQHGLSLLPITQPLEIDLEDEDHYAEEMLKMGGRDPDE